MSKNRLAQDTKGEQKSSILSTITDNARQYGIVGALIVIVVVF